MFVCYPGRGNVIVTVTVIESAERIKIGYV